MSGTADDMLAVAASQVGYNGAGTEDNPDTKYGEWFGYNYPAPSAQWCDMFLSWCADRAGVDLLPAPKGSAGVAVTWNAYEAAGLTTDSEPRRGDLIVFNYSDHPNHIGIVEAVNSDGTLTTIQGNTTDAGIGRTGNCCRRKIVYRTSPYIVGYCRPQYHSATPPPEVKDEFDMASLDDLKKALTEPDVLDAIAARVVSHQNNAGYAGKLRGTGQAVAREVAKLLGDQNDKIAAAARQQIAITQINTFGDAVDEHIKLVRAGKNGVLNRWFNGLRFAVERGILAGPEKGGNDA